MQRLIDAIADLVTSRRTTVLILIMVATAATGGWIPTLVADPRPQQLTVSSVENQEQINAIFNARFGNPDHVVVLLVEASGDGDILSPEALAYVHRLATGFEHSDYVRRVEGITVTPMAIADEDDGAPNPENIETLENLDDLEDEPDPPPIDPELEDALSALIAAPQSASLWAWARSPRGWGRFASRPRSKATPSAKRRPSSSGSRSTPRR